MFVHLFVGKLSTGRFSGERQTERETGHDREVQGDDQPRLGSDVSLMDLIGLILQQERGERAYVHDGSGELVW